MSPFPVLSPFLVLVRLLGLLFVCGLLGLAGCDGRNHSRDSSPATQPKAQHPYATILRELRESRAGVLATPTTDQTMIGRIDQVIPLVERRSPELAQRPFLLMAVFVNDTTVIGADLCSLRGVAPIRDVEKIEFLNASGNVVATCRRPFIGWGAKDTSASVGTFTMLCYLAPSAFDSPSDPPSPGVREGMTEGQFEVVTLPRGSDADALAARIVFGDGTQTEAVRIWRDVVPR